MKNRLLDFYPTVFFKVLAATLGVVFLGWAGSYVMYGELTRTDIIGSLICTPIFSYMVHLWIVYARERPPDDEEV